MHSTEIFKPTRHRWFILYNRYYNLLQASDDIFSNYNELERAEEDAINFRNYIYTLGASPDDIVFKENPSFDYLATLMKDLNHELYQGEKDGVQTSVTFYYAGHGLMKNYTFAVLNQATGRKMFGLEA